MARSKLARIAIMFDDYIFDMLKKGGEIVRTNEGVIIMDDKGKPLREISPSLLGQIERRMHHGGMSLSGTMGDGKGIGGAVKELQRTGKLKLAGNGKLQRPQEGAAG